MNFLQNYFCNTDLETLKKDALPLDSLRPIAQRLLNQKESAQRGYSSTYIAPSADNIQTLIQEIEKDAAAKKDKDQEPDDSHKMRF